MEHKVEYDMFKKLWLRRNPKTRERRIRLLYRDYIKSKMTAIEYIEWECA